MEKETTVIMEAVNFTTITKKEVLKQDPSELIDLLNKYDKRSLNRNDERNFESAQDIIESYITMN